MNTRFRCAAPAQNIATSQASYESWREPASFPAERLVVFAEHSVSPLTATAGDCFGGVR
jgi:hypothetical protein